MEIYVKSDIAVLLSALILAGCSGEDRESVDDRESQRSCLDLPVKLEAREKDGALPRKIRLGNKTPWRFERTGSYIEAGRNHHDFRALASVEDVKAVADEIEKDILAAEGGQRRAGIDEYLTLAEEFSDSQHGIRIDGMTGQKICDAESFPAWSNRIEVSYAFLSRALEFARENDFIDDVLGTAQRYRQAVNELSRLRGNGDTKQVAVLEKCVMQLADELDREDGLPKKLYDHYRSGCKTDEEAKYMLNFISRRMGRLPKWAETQGSANEGGKAGMEGATP